MAAVSRSESRRLYSWWWDSHISPKNSRWLQENLKDMDGKVKSMIKLIEEDADSFARRAEMYYKKRPELMKLVEEFYRAYRALAERYNHAAGELHHAQCAIADSLNDQVPFEELSEDSPSRSFTPDREPHTPEIKLPVRVLFNEDDLQEDAHALSVSDARSVKNGSVGRGLMQEKDKEESFHDEVLQISNENRNLTDKVFHETERAGKAESEVQDLKIALGNVQVEKDMVLIQYQQCLNELSVIEGELSTAQKDLIRLDEKSGMAEIEIQTLKESLVQIEAEKIAALVKYTEYLQKISDMEAMISLIQEDRNGLDERAIKAENEVQSLKDEIERLILENKAILDQYKQSLAKISDLEKIISDKEDDAKQVQMHAKRADTEINELKKTIAELNKEKEASTLQYKFYLETINKLETDLSAAKVNVERLENEVMSGTEKLRTAEENNSLLDVSNQSLRVEADNLAKEIAMKDRELSEKDEELEKFQTRLHDEHLRYLQLEASLHNLQTLNSQSQDDRRALELELKNVLQMLKDLEDCKKGLEREIHQVRDGNSSLSQTNLSSTVKMESLQNEIDSLREMKQKLEKEVALQMSLNNSLQQQILSLKKEIDGLSTSYQALIEQVKAAGLNQKYVGASLKILEDENLKLRHVCDQNSSEREILSKKLESIEKLLMEKSSTENFLIDLNRELEGSHGKGKAFDNSLREENIALVAEKASLFSQLQTVTENMHRLLEKNAVLENSLFGAKIEVEGLREKSKGLEEICRLLKNERSHLLTERDSLALKLENVERKLESLEKRYMGLEEEHAGLLKEKEAMQSQVEELKLSLGLENQERITSQLQSETRFAGVENHIHLLQQEENMLKKNKYEEELERALKSQFEISILKKFMKDTEEKNYSLITECQKHVEASKMAERVISELENESLEQQVETELLLDEIERLRLDIYQVFRALETVSNCVPEEKIENEKALVHHILGNVEKMQCSISKYEDDKQQLFVENSILLTVLEELESKGIEIESQKTYFEHEFNIMAKTLAVIENEMETVLEMNRQLKSDVGEGHQHAAKLEAELGSLYIKQTDLQKSYSILREAYARANEENKSLLTKFSNLKEEKCHADQHNDAALLEFLTTANDSAALFGSGMEKKVELKLILDDLNRKHEVKCGLEKQMSTLRGQLEFQKTENFLLTEAVHNLEKEIQGIREYNVQMKKDMTSSKESLTHTEEKLLDTEKKLEAAENLNFTLSKIAEKLKAEIHESLQISGDQEKSMPELSEDDDIQQKIVESLHSVNTKLESELGLFRNEVEEKIITEQTPSSDLQDKNDELELWESEAEAFYFDLQVSSIHEVMFQDKVQELTGVCKGLENERVEKMLENEQMKGKIFSMASEIGGLKSELNAYAPIIASLRDDIAFLEHHTILKAAQNESQILEVAADPRRSMSKKVLVDQSFLSLQKLQTRIKAVRKLMEEMNKPILLRRSNVNTEQEPHMNEIAELQPQHWLDRDKHGLRKNKRYELRGTPKLRKIKNKATEVWNGMLMKDINLDRVSRISRHGLTKGANVGTCNQSLELWETSEDVEKDQTAAGSLSMPYKIMERGIVRDHFENAKHKMDMDKLEVSRRSAAFHLEMDNRKIHERLASNAKKLEILQIIVENLRTKLMMTEVSRKSKNIDFETVHEQLLEAEETIVYLGDLNVQLEKNIDESPSQDDVASPNETKKMQRMKAMEQARKGSERIERLHLELQKIDYILLKLVNDNKNNGRNKFFKNKTIILRDFIYNGRKNSGKRKKSPLCGCLKPSTSRNERSL